MNFEDGGPQDVVHGDVGDDGQLAGMSPTRAVATVAVVSGLFALVIVGILIATGVFQSDDVPDVRDDSSAAVLAADERTDLTVYLTEEVREDEDAILELIDRVVGIDGVSDAGWLSPLIVQGVAPGSDPIIVEEAVIVVQFDEGGNGFEIGAAIRELDGVIAIVASP